MATVWTASSDAARQACGDAAARSVGKPDAPATGAGRRAWLPLVGRLSGEMLKLCRPRPPAGSPTPSRTVTVTVTVARTRLPAATRQPAAIRQPAMVTAARGRGGQLVYVYLHKCITFKLLCAASDMM
jgi:hypothetical protein